MQECDNAASVRFYWSLPTLEGKIFSDWSFRSLQGSSQWLKACFTAGFLGFNCKCILDDCYNSFLHLLLAIWFFIPDGKSPGICHGSRITWGAKLPCAHRGASVYTLFCNKCKVICSRVPFREKWVKYLRPKSSWDVATAQVVARAGRGGGKEPVSYTKFLLSRARRSKAAERQAGRSAVIRAKSHCRFMTWNASQHNASCCEWKRLRIPSCLVDLWGFGGILGKSLRMSLQYCAIRFESKYLFYLAWEMGSFAVPPHLFRYNVQFCFPYALSYKWM